MRLPFSALLVTAGLGLATGCREADLAPLRADLASSAGIVCAAPVARPPHAARTREVQPADVEAAIAKLCDAESAHVETPAEPLAVLHEALVQERAITGQLRRSRLLIDAPRVDLGAIKPNAEGLRTAEEALTRASASHCGPSWPGLDRVILASAVALAKSSHGPEALERCADVVALARDEDLTGDLTDLLLANSQLQRAVKTCTPIVDAAPKEATAKLATSLAMLRSTFPATLEDALRRDFAEMMLFAFGKGRDSSSAFACERANALASMGDAKPLTRGERIELEGAWKTARTQPVPDPKYGEAYTLTLRLLDQFVEHARER